MRARQQRTTVSQDHLDRSAAIIDKMAKRKKRTRRESGEKLDDIQRYAFIQSGPYLIAQPAPRGSKKNIGIGGWDHPVRVPRTRAEHEAAVRAGVDLITPAEKRPDGVVAKMARKIVEAAGRGVQRRDFRQAGVADDLIDANFDKAMKLARRMDRNIDSMVEMPCAI